METNGALLGRGGEEGVEENPAQNDARPESVVPAYGRLSQRCERDGVVAGMDPAALMTCYDMLVAP
jgi:hypothetical protein